MEMDDRDPTLHFIHGGPGFIRRQGNYQPMLVMTAILTVTSFNH